MEAFLAGFETCEVLALGQVLVRREGGSGAFEIRHAEDASRGGEALALHGSREMRTRVQYNGHGAFRPLRTSPDLIRGWRIVAPTVAALEEALECIYPGALADWHAAKSQVPPVTHFREFTQRQTGMFRVITRLDDAQAAETVRACCAASFCIRRRLWTVPGLETDAEGQPGKSSIPCLEPCALLMELARKAARLHQDAAEKGFVPVQVAPEDLRTIREALERLRDTPEPGARQADFGDRMNPRRLQWLLERLPTVVEKPGSAGGGE